MHSVVDLAVAGDVPGVGGKAANLGRLVAAGFVVPAGFVVTSDAFTSLGAVDIAAAVESAASALGDGPFAVRSSAVAEDLTGASYAGLYETYLNVPRQNLAEAVRRCQAAAGAERVTEYHARRGVGDPATGMAVLVQTMVPAEAAGVAFTADPVTGDRDRVLVTAVRGLGERLVAGHTVGDEWTVRGGQIERGPLAPDAIDAGQAVEVALLARAVEAHFGAPQDIEWAYAHGKLWLLQARPMTALPEPVEWSPPGPGVWARNFRLGEWLPDPMTPLFADWLLPRIVAGFSDGMRHTAGAVLPFGHASVNGWYYTTPHAQITPWRLIRGVIASRGRLLSFVYHGLVQGIRDPVAADAALLGRLYRQWREDLLPDYQRYVQAAETGVGTAAPARLIETVDEVAHRAGVHLWYLAMIGGSAWKCEAALERFTRRHLPGVLPSGVVVLLAGLPGAQTAPPPWAVTSFDWHTPTLAELPASNTGPVPGKDRVLRLVTDRHAAEQACRAALADRPRHAVRFDALLGVAQRYAAIREEQARHLTVGWPLLRRAANQLAHLLHSRRILDHPDDLFFLTRAELDTALDPNPDPLGAVAAERRRTWERQRRAAAPLQLGKPPRLLATAMTHVGAGHPEQAGSHDGIIAGRPASPGRVTGPARILYGPEDFARLRAGEVLVAPATTPAWTVLFDVAAAVVTDGGTLAAHASLVAREYGIPAVVATGEATHRIRDGQLVTVDGSTGTVTLQDG